MTLNYSTFFKNNKLHLLFCCSPPHPPEKFCNIHQRKQLGLYWTKLAIILTSKSHNYLVSERGINNLYITNSLNIYLSLSILYIILIPLMTKQTRFSFCNVFFYLIFPIYSWQTNNTFINFHCWFLNKMTHKFCLIHENFEYDELNNNTIIIELNSHEIYNCI